MTPDQLKEELRRETGIPLENWYCNGTAAVVVEGRWSFNARTFRLCADALDRFTGNVTGTKTPTTKTPAPSPVSLSMALAALQECVLALDRYAGPGTRGQVATRAARAILKANGIEV